MRSWILLADRTGSGKRLSGCEEVEKRDAKSIHFAALVKDETLRALEAFGYKPFCGVS